MKMFTFKTWFSQWITGIFLKETNLICSECLSEASLRYIAIILFIYELDKKRFKKTTVMWHVEF